MFLPSIVLAAFVSALSSSATLPAIGTNDNRTPAGTFADGTLTLNLRAAEGIWRPEGASGPALQIQAFGEITSSLVIPAPLIRVPEGTDIRAIVRNDLSMPLRVHGLCDRLADNAAPGDKTACAPLDVPPGETRSAAFKAAAPGTYHYWATTTGMPFVFRAVGDTQLAGAFVVDPKRRSDVGRSRSS